MLLLPIDLFAPAHDAFEEVFEAWSGGLLGGLIGCWLLLLDGGGSRGATQFAVGVKLRVAVWVGQDYPVFDGPRSRAAGGRRELGAVGVEGVEGRLGCSLDVGLGLGARLHRGAVFVIVHIAVVAILGLALDAQLVADLVD